MDFHNTGEANFFVISGCSFQCWLRLRLRTWTPLQWSESNINFGFCLLRIVATNTKDPSWGPAPYRGEEVCAPKWHQEICRRERKLLVEPPKPSRSEGKSQTKCSPWSLRWEIWRGANDPTPEKFTVSKQRRRPRPKQGCGARKEEEEKGYIINWVMDLQCGGKFSLSFIRTVFSMTGLSQQ